ncbi:MAG: hypothetical protein KR126chlam6_00421 [Candidatus Anoxychlamydiales bacterium]|nr:hypothetical protein [Candidatus Anoxychlamydiales bacterium]
MNIKKIISSIALFMFSGSLLFAADIDTKPQTRPTFRKVNKEIPQIDEKVEKDKNSFFYLNGQALLFLPPENLVLPEAGIGYRYRNGFHGFDANMSIDPIMSFNIGIPIAITSASYLGYFNSKNNTSTYYGLGLSSSLPMPFFVSPDLILGRQFDKKFIQLKVHFLQTYESKYSSFTPSPSLSVGFGF